jgi:GntR family transcriptional regulator/MocR family aminotransferase
VDVTADDVIITNGTLQALDVIGRTLVEPRARVAMENPGYPLVWHLFVSLGARIAPVPGDEEGLVVDAIPDGTKLVYVSPHTSSRWGWRCRFVAGWRCCPGRIGTVPR